MNKSSWIIFLCCVLTAIFVWGQVQRAQPVPFSAAGNNQFVSREFDDMKLEVARLKAEVEKLTNVIKIYGSTVEIKASAIKLDGKLYVYSNSFFYQSAYSYVSTEFYLIGPGH